MSDEAEKVRANKIARYCVMLFINLLMWLSAGLIYALDGLGPGIAGTACAVLHTAALPYVLLLMRRGESRG